MSILDEILSIKSSKKDLRSFGWVIGIACLIISGIMLFKGNANYIAYAIAGVVVILEGVILPILLIPFQKIWMVFAVIMGFIMTRVILAILFFFILSLISLISGIAGKRFLDMKIDKSKKSYWNKREVKEFTKEQYDRQF